MASTYLLIVQLSNAQSLGYASQYWSLAELENDALFLPVVEDDFEYAAASHLDCQMQFCSIFEL